MRTRMFGATLVAGGVAAALLAAPTATAEERPETAARASFNVYEATIPDIQAAITSGVTTCEAVVQGYLDRIEAYDDAGPSIHAVITVNDEAIDQARAFDAALKPRTRPADLRALDCVPVLVKDNLDTTDMPTTAGSLAFEGYLPEQDSTVVTRLREAGAIIIGKGNLDEFARGSSGLSGAGGQTLNPYDLTRVPGGSSAGIGAGITANFATVGIGTETGVSIRNPATNGSLVGVAPTRGLISGAGIVPISFTQDRAGPITRSVADAATVLSVIDGYDPRDPQTALSRDRIPASYDPAAGGLEGARIGVVRELFGSTEAEAESAAIVDAAVADLEAQGATVLQDVPLQEALDLRLPVLDPLYPNEDASLVRVLSDARTNNYEQRTAMNMYLDAAGDSAPYEDLTGIIESGKVLPSLVSGFEASDQIDLTHPEYVERLLRIAALQSATTKVMADLDLDALVYPMKTQPAPTVGGTSPPGTTPSSGNVLSPITGFPAVVVPAGFTAGGMPVSIELLGTPFTEQRLLELAAGYEAATGHRVPPASTPILGDPSTPADPPALTGPAKKATANGAGRFAVTVGCVSEAGACTGTVSVTHGSSALGSKQVRLQPDASRTVRFALPARLATRVAKGKAVTVAVRVTGTGETVGAGTTRVVVRKR